MSESDSDSTLYTRWLDMRSSAGFSCVDGHTMEASMSEAKSDEERVGGMALYNWLSVAAVLASIGFIYWLFWL